MAKKIGEYQIPFNKNGDQLHYPAHYTMDTGRWKDNFTFEGVLEITRMERGMSAAYFHAKDQEGRGYTMFMKDLFEALPYMAYGKLTGRFTFTKRGNNYGVKYLPSLTTS